MQHKLMNLHMVINHNMHTVMEKKNHKASKGKKKKKKNQNKRQRLNDLGGSSTYYHCKNQ